LLVASALSSGNSGASQAARSSIHADEAEFEQLRFHSVEDVRRRRPRYEASLLPESANWRLSLGALYERDPGLAADVESLSPDSDRYRFLVLAGLLGRYLGIPEALMPDYQWQIQKSLREAGYGR
jgi:hypothetical protein